MNVEEPKALQFYNVEGVGSKSVEEVSSELIRAVADIRKTEKDYAD